MERFYSLEIRPKCVTSERLARKTEGSPGTRESSRVPVQGNGKTIPFRHISEKCNRRSARARAEGLLTVHHAVAALKTERVRPTVRYSVLLRSYGSQST